MSYLYRIPLIAIFVVLFNFSLAQTWSGQTSNFGSIALNDVAMIDANTGYIVGNSGAIQKTTNGGSTWIGQSTPGTATMHSVSFSDANNGTAVGASGTIYRTTNGGTNWSSQTSGVSILLLGVSFTDVNNGTAVGQSGTIIRTTNGSTWSSQTSGVSTWLSDVHFTDANTGTAVGEGGKILRTTNGSSWSSQTSGTTNWLQGVYFVDANTGYAVGESGTVLKTTNGGTNWSSQTSGVSVWLQAVYFIDANGGVAVGENGTIITTENGGSNWTTNTSGTSNWLYGVSFSDEDTGTAVGLSGTIRRTTNAALPVELTSFTALINENNSVELNWETATEINNYGFEIEKSYPGPVSLNEGDSYEGSPSLKEWEKIGFVKGNGNSNSPKSYNFTDKELPEGKVLYRLKQIDYDGTFEYSNVLEVSSTQSIPGEFVLNQNYPNPFNPTTAISYQLSVESRTKLEIFDPLGRLVSTLVDEKQSAGSYSYNFNAGNSPSGIYIYRLTSENFSETKKMLFIK